MQLNSPRDKPIELIDGDELIELLTTHSLLTTGNEGLSPTQTTSTLLRNQIAGISEKFQNQFVQIDTRLILDRRSFGDDHQMSTYKSFGEWTSKIELRFHEQTHGAQTVSRELLQFQSSGPSNYADSQQIRKQLDELFQHGLALLRGRSESCCSFSRCQVSQDPERDDSRTHRSLHRLRQEVRGDSRKWWKLDSL